jgi:uncharacterized protein DUF11
MVGAIVVVGVLGIVSAVPPQVDVVPALTSTPFGAAPGRPVSHTITLSGTGTGVVPGVTVTLAMTVGLDGPTATASRGSCPVVTAQKVVCELGDLTYPDAPVKVTVTGTVHPGTPAGTLVQNLVTVTAPDADRGNNAVSNAYLVAGPSTGPTMVPVGPRPRGPTNRVPVAAAGAGLAVLGAAALLLWVLRIRRGDR